MATTELASFETDLGNALLLIIDTRYWTIFNTDVRYQANHFNSLEDAYLNFKKLKQKLNSIK